MLGYLPRTLLILAVFHSIAACTAAAVTGSTDGGYRAGQYEQSTGISANDAIISSEINERYVKDPLVSAFDVHVETRRGVVNLSGTVPSRQAAQRAVSLASSVDGANRVVNQLKVMPGKKGQ
jgi:osmotically-inducible protein OsmY